jgi:hypothetical protein
MKLLLIKTVFCPTKKYLNDTIISLFKTTIIIEILIKKYSLEIDLYLIGWVYKFGTLFEKCIDILKYKYSNIFKNLWHLNYGKYKILNDCINFVKNNNKYINIIFMDHDIYFNYKSIDVLYKLLSNTNEFDKHNIGLIAFNHLIDIRHQLSIYDNYININKIVLVWPNITGSIATGGFIIKANIFSQLTDFKLLSVYGLDDYYLCNELQKNGFLNVVAKDCFIIHPFDNNKKYKQWKKQNIINMINGSITNYYLNIEHSINLLT